MTPIWSVARVLATAASLLSSPLRTGEFPEAGKLTGNFSDFARLGRLSRKIHEVSQRFGSEFPAPTEQGISVTGTGNFSAVTGNFRAHPEVTARTESDGAKPSFEPRASRRRPG
jgi:hypothetical protein